MNKKEKNKTYKISGNPTSPVSDSRNKYIAKNNLKLFDNEDINIERDTYSIDEFKIRFEKKLEDRLGLKISL